MMKSGRKPRRRKVSWFGTVKMRLAINWEFRKRSGEQFEIFLQRTAHLALEYIRKGRDRAAAFVERNPFHPLHGKKQRGQADAIPFGVQDLVHEIVEGVQVDAAERDAGRGQGQ